MPHLNEGELNHLPGMRQRLERSERRSRGSYLPGSTLVGNRLLRTLLAAYDAQERLRAAGWAVADDGDPYQPHG